MIPTPSHLRPHRMMVISRTPVRISFFGGGTDYPTYFQRAKGATLGTTIDQYTYVSVNILSNFFDHKIRVGYSKTELAKDPEEIEHPSVRECLKFLNLPHNFDIHIFSDLPARTGLGSSSSFTVGFLNALYALQGRRLSKQQLAEQACHIEQKCIKENVGSQDQFHAAFGGFNLFEFQNDAISVRPVVLPPFHLKHLEQHLLVFFTGLTRFASQVLDEQLAKTEKRSNDSYLEEMYSIVFEAEKILMSPDPDRMVENFGKLLDQSWQLKKQLSSKISNPMIDEIYDKCKRAGAYGGKLCGAGTGGFLALIAPLDAHAKIRDALKDLLEVHFKFENMGSSIVYMKD